MRHISATLHNQLKALVVTEGQRKVNIMDKCVCDYCIHNDDEDQRCLMNQEEYGDVSDEDDCDFYEEDEESEDREDVIKCPRCGEIALWEIDEYVCQGDCGWHGQKGDSDWDDDVWLKEDENNWDDEE